MKGSRILTIVLAVMALLAVPRAYGQEEGKWSGNFRADIYAGITTPLDHYHDGIGKPGLQLGLNLKWRFARIPLDAGVYAQFEAVRRSFGMLGTITPWDGENFGPSEPYYYTTTQSNNTYTIGVMGEWNFRRGKMVNPYAGLGIGASIYNTPHDCHPSSGTTISFTPRVGVELFKRLRFTLEAQMFRKGYNSASLSIGLGI